MEPVEFVSIVLSHNQTNYNRSAPPFMGYEPFVFFILFNTKTLAKIGSSVAQSIIMLTYIEMAAKVDVPTGRRSLDRTGPDGRSTSAMNRFRAR
jgi:hypothetical protein